MYWSSSARSAYSLPSFSPVTAFTAAPATVVRIEEVDHVAVPLRMIEPTSERGRLVEG